MRQLGVAALAATLETGRGLLAPDQEGDAGVEVKIYADLTRELSVLIAADIPLDACLRLLMHQTANKGLRALAERLLAAVTGGQPLSAAMAEADPDAPALLVNLLRAGEARGGLAPALADLAALFEQRLEMQGKIRANSTACCCTLPSSPKRITNATSTGP